MNIIQFLMDEDEVQEALVAYRTDPTDENKRRVIETLLRERESAPDVSEKPTVLGKPPHRFVLIPHTTAINRERVEVSGGQISWDRPVDRRLLDLAKCATRVGHHVHELGGSAVFVRFTAEEWHETFMTQGLPMYLAAMQDALKETESLEAIAVSMEKLIRVVGNMTELAYSKRLIGQMYAVAENRHDDTVSRALVAMVDLKRTKNIPAICKEPEDENEEE